MAINLIKEIISVFVKNSTVHLTSGDIINILSADNTLKDVKDSTARAAIKRCASFLKTANYLSIDLNNSRRGKPMFVYTFLKPVIQEELTSIIEEIYSKYRDKHPKKNKDSESLLEKGSKITEYDYDFADEDNLTVGDLLHKKVTKPTTKIETKTTEDDSLTVIVKGTKKIATLMISFSREENE